MLKCREDVNLKSIEEEEEVFILIMGPSVGIYETSLLLKERLNKTTFNNMMSNMLQTT